jgi:hypothetical protein
VIGARLDALRRGLRRRLQRRLTRSGWLARLLQLPESTGASDRPGLLMIQVDGLSRAELERALARGETPFLARLWRREGYRLHSHYSGLPSTTPAVQAELFYGEPCAVPAFAFRDHESGDMVRMYEPAAARGEEERQRRHGREGLLAGGSAYADTLDGDAAEAHFCPSALGWGPALRAANPLVVGAFLLSNLYSFVRVLALLVLELGLALYDFVGGLLRGRNFLKELKFVPTRVGISILLRELCVIGGKIDLSRGLPVVHVNLIGYDEQSHRRGPRSLFAHWTLKGIDDAVARLWRAAQGSTRRQYQVWLYSDHGQAAVRAFDEVRGYSLEEAVLMSLERVGRDTLAAVPRLRESVENHRARLLGGKRVQRLFGVLDGEPEAADLVSARVAALGPVGHVYLPEGLAAEARDRVARELSGRHGVPLVLTRCAGGSPLVLAAGDAYELPRDQARLFGAAHPFVDELGNDLMCLFAHPDAGDIVVLGWRDGVAALTFARENGAHGGASPDETHGFALLPEAAPLAATSRGYLRPMLLRDAALHHLGRGAGSSGPCRERDPRTATGG